MHVHVRLCGLTFSLPLCVKIWHLQTTLTEKLDMWVSRFETDAEAKAKELENLKASRAADLGRLQVLPLAPFDTKHEARSKT